MPAHENSLLDLLPLDIRRRLLACGEIVVMELAQVLCVPGSPTDHVYFPTEGYISLLTQACDSTSVEVGMVGCEGMLGTQLVLGVDNAPLRGLVQGKGAAWRIPSPAFLEQLARSPALVRVLQRYLHVRTVQLAGAVACQRFHVVSGRLARWLLMSQDRARSDRFHMTQEFLAYMLGVRRVGITSAANVLQLGGLIEYRRGNIHVLDRAGLERAACTCYTADRYVYTEVMGLRSSIR